jgi:glucose-1-phosphate cytidylyltransferase
MKVILLAGGYGTRISEETDIRPKPMVEIGGKPILWHIMKTYSHYGFNDFIICLGYKGFFIKEYFANYFLHQSDLTIDLSDNSRQVHNNASENWKITLVDTGLNTMTGGRIKRIQKYIGNEPFLLTYGDGLSNVNISDLVENHSKSGKKCTVTGIRPQGRFGLMKIGSNNDVLNFAEKKDEDNSMINGGYFVCEPSVFEYIKEGDKTIWEKEPLETLAKERELNLNYHDGFWKPMDSLKDKMDLNELWNTDKAIWKIWK